MKAMHTNERLDPKNLDACPIVMVRWRDATSHGSWMRELPTAKTMCMNCSSVGYLVAEFKDSITLALTVSEDGFACDLFAIPKPFVMKRLWMAKKSERSVRTKPGKKR